MSWMLIRMYLDRLIDRRNAELGHGDEAEPQELTAGMVADVFARKKNPGAYNAIQDNADSLLISPD